MSTRFIQDMYFPVRTVQGGYKVNNYKGVLDTLVNRLSIYLNNNNEVEPTVRNLDTVYNNEGLSIIGVNSSNSDQNFINYYIDIEFTDLNRVFHLFNTYPSESNVKNQRTYTDLLHEFRPGNITSISSLHWLRLSRFEGSLRSKMFGKLRDILQKASNVVDDDSPYLSYPKLRHNKPIYATLNFRYSLSYKDYILQGMGLDSDPYRQRIVDTEKTYIPVDYLYNSLIQADGRRLSSYFYRKPKNQNSVVVGSGVALPNIYSDSANVCWGSNRQHLNDEYKLDNLPQIPKEFLNGVFNLDLNNTNVYLINLKDFFKECQMNYNDLLLLNQIPQHELGFSEDILQLLTDIITYFNRVSEVIEEEHMLIKDNFLEESSDSSPEKQLLTEQIFQSSKNGDFFKIQISAIFLTMIANLTHTPLDSLHGNHDVVTDYLGSLYKHQYVLEP